MRHLSVLIDEPQALDAFAYRGSLFVLTFDGRVLTYDVTQVAAELLATHGAAGLVAAYGLFSSKGIGATPEMKSAWKAFDHTSSLSLTLRSAPVSMSRIVEASVYLDMRLYYNCLFLATDLGTYSAPLDAVGRVTDEIADVERIIRNRTESLSTGMGAVGASLGEEGLAVFMGIDARSRATLERRVEVRSLRSTIGWGSAVSYPTHDSYEVLESRFAEDRPGRRKLVGIAAPSPEARSAVELNGAYAVWESGRLLMADSSGVVSLGRAAAAGYRRWLVEASGARQPLWLGVTGNRFIVTEYSDGIKAARDGQHIVIHDGPAASVRTFSGSQRYRRLITATVEGGLLLSAAFAADIESQ